MLINPFFCGSLEWSRFTTSNKKIMDSKFHYLQDNKIFIFTPLPLNCKPMNYKWISIANKMLMALWPDINLIGG